MKNTKMTVEEKEAKLAAAIQGLVDAEALLRETIREVFAPGTTVQCNVGGNITDCEVDEAVGLTLTLKAKEARIIRHFDAVRIRS
jgi:hypothetical protein